VSRALELMRVMPWDVPSRCSRRPTLATEGQETSTQSPLATREHSIRPRHRELYQLRVSVVERSDTRRQTYTKTCQLLIGILLLPNPDSHPPINSLTKDAQRRPHHWLLARWYWPCPSAGVQVQGPSRLCHSQENRNHFRSCRSRHRNAGAGSNLHRQHQCSQGRDRFSDGRYSGHPREQCWKELHNACHGRGI
jgi:hypothetical protein